jgi:tetratricopeptide (TPR) repeat protein
MSEDQNDDDQTDSDQGAAGSDADKTSTDEKQKKDTAEKKDADKDASAEPSEKDLEASKKGWFGKGVAVISDFRAFLLNTIIILSVIAAIWSGYLEFTKTSVVIEPVAIPEEMQKNGFSPRSVAQSIVDRMLLMQEVAQLRTKRVPLQPSWSELDIKVPGSELSVRSVVQYLKRETGNEDTRMEGELTKENGKLHLVMRQSGSETGVISDFSGDPEHLDELLNQSAEAALSEVQPCIVAAYWYSVEFKSRKYDKAMQAVQKCLASDDKDNVAQGYNLWGNMLADRGQYDEAVAKYTLAAGDGNKCVSAEACVNIGKSRASRGDNLAAIEQYKNAISSDSTVADAYASWGDSLSVTGRYAEAAAKCNVALKLDPTTKWPALCVGLARKSEGKIQEAVHSFTEALEFAKRKSAHTGRRTGPDVDVNYSDMAALACRALWELGRYQEALAQCQLSSALDPLDPGTHANIGVLELGLWRINDSLAECNVAIGLRPDWVDGHVCAGDAYLALGRVPAAMTEYRKAIAIDPTFRDVRVAFGKALAAVGDKQGAIDQYALALKANPNDADAHIQWAYVEWSRGDTEGVFAHLATALAISPSQISTHVDLGNLLRARGRYADAARQFAIAASIPALNSGDYHLRGLAQANMGHYRQAFIEYRNGASLNPLDDGVHVDWGGALEATGDHSGAIAQYKAALAINPNNAAVQITLGNTLRSRNNPGDAAEAMQHYEVAAMTPAVDSGGYRDRGTAQTIMLRYNEALIEFQKGLDINPLDDSIRLAWGNTLAAMGSYADAITQYKLALNANPNNAEAHLQWALADWHQENIEQTIAHAEAGLAISPTMIEDQNNLGAFLRGQGRYIEAARHFAIAASTPAVSSNDYRLRGLAQAGMGHYREALIEYRNGAAVSPLDDAVHVAWGDALYATGDHAGAIAQYKAAVAINPNNAGVRNALGNMLRSRNNPGDEAEAMLNYQSAATTPAFDSVGYRERGVAQASMTFYSEALIEYQKGIDLNSLDDSIYVMWGNALIAMGNYDGAIEKYKLALRANPNNVEAHVQWAFAAGQRGDVGQEIAHLEAALVISPSMIVTQNDLGDVYQNSGDQSNARRCYEAALTIPAVDAGTHFERGRAYDRLGYANDAMAECRAANAIDRTINCSG